MADCNGQCGSCDKSNCGDRNEFLAKLNGKSSVKKVIGVVSGKGGVGKSLVTALTAVAARRSGAKVGILDADITGPSIPRLFGITEKAEGTGEEIYPAFSKTGIEIMSINLLLPEETDPVVWRGPVISGAVTQFWTDVVWNDVDYMFVDMPPGTGDVALTVFQSLPIDGIILVTSPQELVSMIVKKALNMAKMMNVPIIGAVENMSGVVCPHCGEQIDLFGASRVSQIEAEGVKVLAKLPLDPTVAAKCDAGRIEDVCLPQAENIFKAISEK